MLIASAHAPRFARPTFDTYAADIDDDAKGNDPWPPERNPETSPPVPAERHAVHAVPPTFALAVRDTTRWAVLAAAAAGVLGIVWIMLRLAGAILAGLLG